VTLSFGTDGIRGVARTELTTEIAEQLGRAAARVLGRRLFLVGRDTRESGPELQAALMEGLAHAGAGVADLGVVPTPAVAFCSARRDAPAAMVSASHNPYTDNGIKLFAAGGRKLSDAVEARVEAEFEKPAEPRGGSAVRSPPEPLSPEPLPPEYGAHLLASLGGRTFGGLRVVLDCANGAASAVAPDVFAAAGADVVAIHDRPDGTNINDRSGSTHPESLQGAVLARRADLGLAFDGDADRVLAVAADGALVDGDHLIALLAVDRKSRGALPGDTVVVTVMSNLGFRLAMAGRGIAVHETSVGDRYVLEALEANGWALGGEQSGHIIFRDVATTGDGLLTGLAVCDAVARTGRPLSELARVMTRLPQVLRNVPVAADGRARLDSADGLWAEVRQVEAALGDTGRVLLRPSGTEPVVRVMVEAADAERARAAAEQLCAAVVRELGR
jgi:phosphoglucosamine mutase